MVAKKARLVCTGALLALVMSGCSEQQQEEDLEISDDQQGNVDDQEANESNSEGNFEDEQSQENEELNEQSNNDIENDTQEDEEPVQNVNAALENPPANNPTADAGLTPTNPEPVAETPPADPASNAAPPSDAAPVPGGRVRYVREAGAQIVDKPGGNPVGQLTQGDHPVTWEENGWLRITNGMYVPVDAMSDQGVPRPMPGNRFQ